MDPYEPVKLFERLELGMLCCIVSWEDEIVPKILISQFLVRFWLQICDCFQNFWIFLSFSEFNDHYLPTKHFKSCTWENSRDKKQFWTFWLRNLEAFLLNSAIFCTFSKNQFLFGLLTNKAIKLKVAESNQAKASLTKPCLATDEATRLPVVWDQFARR